ncbi:hypothetical protein O181_071594, partial [Austropuccinia psidii MF-1]|nr:hypothetical protein [Austropuccinia psidii MF-1]
EYQLLRMIPLTEIHTCAEVQVKQHDNTFGIVTPTRTFYARAHSRIERDQWTKKVTDAKLQLKSLERSQLQILNELEPNLIDPLSQIQTSTHLQSINNHQIKLNHHHPTNLSPSSPQFPNSISINHQNITPIITTSINPSNSFVPSPSSSAISWVEEHQNDHHLGTITQASLKRAISSSKKKVKPIPIPSPNPSTSFSYHQSNKIISNETSPRARVDPSQQSFQLLTSSSEEEEVDDEVGLQHLTRRETCGTFTHDPSKIQPQAIQENLDSSRQTNVERKVSLPDACKPIIQGYLMKQGKRKTWRKRYFLLTSQKLVSSRSHMDITGRNSHIIPIARLLDAIEYEPSESLSVSTSILSSSVGATGGVGTSVASPSGTVAMGTATVVHSNNSTSNHGNLKVHEEHCFKIITSERTYLLSAPTEEEEIKWISAVKCLLTHYRANLPKPIGGGILDQRPGDKSPKQIMGQLNNELTKKT